MLGQGGGEEHTHVLVCVWGGGRVYCLCLLISILFDIETHPLITCQICDRGPEISLSFLALYSRLHSSLAQEFFLVLVGSVGGLAWVGGPAISPPPLWISTSTSLIGGSSPADVSLIWGAPAAGIRPKQCAFVALSGGAMGTYPATRRCCIRHHPAEHDQKMRGQCTHPFVGVFSSRVRLSFHAPSLRCELHSQRNKQRLSAHAACGALSATGFATPWPQTTATGHRRVAGGKGLLWYSDRLLPPFPAYPSSTNSKRHAAACRSMAPCRSMPRCLKMDLLVVVFVVLFAIICTCSCI